MGEFRKYIEITEMDPKIRSLVPQVIELVKQQYPNLQMGYESYARAIRDMISGTFGPDIVNAVMDELESQYGQRGQGAQGNVIPAAAAGKEFGEGIFDFLKKDTPGDDGMNDRLADLASRESERMSNTQMTPRIRSVNPVAVDQVEALADYLGKQNPGIDVDALRRSEGHPDEIKSRYGHDVFAPYSGVKEFMSDFRPVEKKIQRMQTAAKRSMDLWGQGLGNRGIGSNS